MSLFHTIFDQFYPVIRFVYERLEGHRWYDPITPAVWLGGAPTYARDYAFLVENGIGAVVDIRNERGDDLAFLQKHTIQHLKVRVPDMVAPPPACIEEGVSFMRQQIEAGRTVYVHCAKGRGRSATLVAGYLMKYEGLSFEEARDLMKAKRPLVKLEARHSRALHEWLAHTSKASPN